MPRGCRIMTTYRNTLITGKVSEILTMMAWRRDPSTEQWLFGHRWVEMGRVSESVSVSKTNLFHIINGRWWYYTYEFWRKANAGRSDVLQTKTGYNINRMSAGAGRSCWASRAWFNTFTYGSIPLSQINHARDESESKDELSVDYRLVVLNCMK